jgi:tRNA pseudouridine55 synthase
MAPTLPTLIDGILIIDKPVGWTSHDVVARLRTILKTRRIGHTGTLDPFATGVLVVCLNQATRLVRFLSSHEKEYLATMRLGWRTDTGDLTGHPIGEPVDPRHLTPELISAALDNFRGVLTQIPPMYSAKKLAGRKLYELAREGREVERAPVRIEIHAIELVGISSVPATPPALDVQFRVSCSAGTYIRTLAEDVGLELGVGAHLVALRRTRAGQCRIEEALTLERLAELAIAERLDEVVRPMLDSLEFPVLMINDEEARAIGHGRAIDRDEPMKMTGWVSLVGQSSQLVALAETTTGEKRLSPRIVFNQT